MAQVPRDDRSWTNHTIYLVIAGVGLTAIMASLVVGLVLAFETGDLFAQDAAARAADADTRGTIAAFAAWNPLVTLTGISLLMTSVVVVLREIISTIGMRGRAMTATLPGLLTPQRSN